MATLLFHINHNSNLNPPERQLDHQHSPSQPLLPRPRLHRTHPLYLPHDQPQRNANDIIVYHYFLRPSLLHPIPQNMWATQAQYANSFNFLHYSISISRNVSRSRTTPMHQLRRQRTLCSTTTTTTPTGVVRALVSLLPSGSSYSSGHGPLAPLHGQPAPSFWVFFPVSGVLGANIRHLAPASAAARQYYSLPSVSILSRLPRLLGSFTLSDCHFLDTSLALASRCVLV